MVDEFFNWKMQIDNLCTKRQNLGYVFRKLCKYAVSKTVKTAYHGYIESRLTYGITAWGCSSKENIERVFEKQKKILRIMSRVDTTASCRKLFVDMKIMTLPCLIIKNCCLEVKKNINIFMTENKVDYNLRTRKKLKCKNNRIENFNVDLFNHLPEYIKNQADDCFKRKLKEFLLSNAFYTMDELKSFSEEQ